MSPLRIVFIFLITSSLLCSCAQKEKTESVIATDIKPRLEELKPLFIESARGKDFNSIITHYADDVILMAEYQPILNGKEEVKAFYTEIFNRQEIGVYERNIIEIINWGEMIVEIGNFKKVFTNKTVQNGKYWNVWEIEKDGALLLKAEAFGFFHPIEDPASLVVIIEKKDSSNLSVQSRKGVKIPFELKAYNALMEKGVRERDGILRTEFFTDDASFYPFADSVKTGADVLRPYLVAYNSGSVTIDSLNIYAYDFHSSGNDIIEYTKFDVNWTVPNISGRTEGKGIRLWKRQADGSLKIYREIGLHDHLQN